MTFKEEVTQKLTDEAAQFQAYKAQVDAQIADIQAQLAAAVTAAGDALTADEKAAILAQIDAIVP